MITVQTHRTADMMAASAGMGKSVDIPYVFARKSTFQLRKMTADQVSQCLELINVS